MGYVSFREGIESFLQNLRERFTPPKFNSEFTPEKLPKPNRKGSSSNHHFSGVFAVKLRGCNKTFHQNGWEVFVGVL